MSVLSLPPHHFSPLLVKLDLETNPSEDSLPSSESYQHYNQACVFPRRHQPLLWGVSCEESADRSVCLHHMPACTETE
ncbi:hypothetical protein Pcinc_022079 [Petrolisthes cinctipes]|uniref:Uncharacterized protein n=1 Tax=Petrolisthes cinctipes TaxID=88211 RepID=A0AAE1KHM2_PETCI|nr:hypothetical protein Pcinc_022079 [Petrolisthes cinctipes]